MKSNKIGLIVEGKTDKKFFEEYFKKRYGLIRNMKVLPSGTGNSCKIMNERAIKNKIEDLKAKECSDIYILIDLDNGNCIVELKNDYIDKLNLKSEDARVIVASSEIEAWMLSALKKSDKRTKEDLKKEYKIDSNNKLEEVLLQKFIASKKDINPANNDSLYYFLNKLGLI